MEKNQQKQEAQFEIVDVQLNQFGRPKQKVIFYELTQELKEQAKSKIDVDNQYLSEQQYEKAKATAQKVWDKFYQHHKCNFFRDRTYLERQCPQLTDFKLLYEKQGTISQYYQLGCGVGNTLFPLLRQFPCFKYYGCDISAKAIKLIEEQMKKHEQLKQKLEVAVCDLVKDEIPFEKKGDLVSMIFVLSAIIPEKHAQVMKKVGEWMKPGSFLYFRDYGRYDFGQVNLSNKKNRKLKDNFYMKNDGVCVYYFQKQELQQMCQKAGLKIIKVDYHCKLLQNRKTGLKMYRVWIQGRFYKPPLDDFFQKRLLMRKQQEALKKQQEEALKKQQQSLQKQQETIKFCNNQENIQKLQKQQKQEQELQIIDKKQQVQKQSQEKSKE